ncbi:SusC/RagA family TonB-linked outer membrane protein [Chitinophaga vietnamensis]|uniref:SusC/RagA family TonB-linked outer membrane protein n=1 Tax=Chitinophaga vietnamensis TaxID=2593957 RepID=UPI0011788080|nr:SusC/RagA family TonB-linked outer membrane protein [Chitinophaga vietnamensis]
MRAKSCVAGGLCRPILIILFLITALDAFCLSPKSYIAPKGDEPDTSIVIPKLTGKVTDSSGMPLPGVTVMVKGTKKGASTDGNGMFTLKDVKQGSWLEVSSVGYESRDARVIGNKIAVHLNMVTKDLEEVHIVSTGYQKLPKERATGSFAFVDNKQFNQRISSDILSRLEGNVAGLVFNKGTVGADGKLNNISIRGHSTLFAVDQPLIVVDNFPYEGDLNRINPNDVESVTVLKDAAAASVWGVRSGNGVIVITTKKGKRSQKLTTTFNSNVTISGKPNLFYSHNFLASSDYIGIEKNLFNMGYYDNMLNSFSTIVSPVVKILSDARSGKISSNEADEKISQLSHIDSRQEYTKYLYQKAITQAYAISINGGGANSDYYLSLGYDRNRATTVGDRDNRVTINSTYNFYPTNNLQIGAGINYVQTINYPNSSAGRTIPNYPYTKLVDEKGNPIEIPVDLTSMYKDSMTNLGFLNWKYIPLAEIKMADNRVRSSATRLSFRMKYDIFPSLDAEINYLYENSGIQTNNYYSQATYHTRNLINLYTQINQDGSLSYPIPIGGINEEGTLTLLSHQVRGQLNYNKKWREHRVSALTGLEIRHNNVTQNTSTAYGFDKSTLNNIPTIDFSTFFPLNPFGSARIPNNIAYSSNIDNYVSYFANAAYTYKETYTVSASFRTDKSNLFGVETNQKAVPLYSAGAAWNLSRENFYHVKWLPYLKIRATYGYTANINKNAAAVVTTLQGTGSPFLGLPFERINNPGNPQLRWERNRMINLAIDYGLMNGAIVGSFEYYLKKSSDVFGQAQLAPSTGVSAFFGNTSGTEGHGAEFQLVSKNINKKNFRWTTDVKASYSIDKVTNYDLKSSVLDFLIYGSGNGGGIIPHVGYPMFAMYSFKFGGLTHDGGDPQGYLNGKLSTDYQSILNGATVDSLIYNGPSRPTKVITLGNTFTYKQFTLSFRFLFNLNYYFRRTSISDVSSITGGTGNVDYYKRWQHPGDELTTNVPSFKYPPINTDRMLFYNYSSALIEKGDNIRVMDINLSYEVDSRRLRRLPVSNLIFTCYLNNIGIIWRANKSKIDPDIYSDGQQIPVPRSIAFGARVTF